MTEQTRRNIFRYGIAIDLVILATGIGMLLPTTAATLVAVFAFATALSVWRGGWQGGVTALLLSFVALLVIFPESMQASHLVAFTALSLVGGAAISYATRSRTVLQASAGAMPVAAPVVIEEEEDFAQKPLERGTLEERGTLAEVVPLRVRGDEEVPIAPAVEIPPVPAESLEARPAETGQSEQVSVDGGVTAPAPKPARKRATRTARSARPAADHERIARELEEARIRAEEEARKREEEERQRIARELEARLAREREEAERHAAEARARAEEEARRREQEERERIARELEARLAREREEAERALAERLEAERKAAELERQRVEAERRAAEEERKRAEEERQRIARELEAQLAREREEAERKAAELERQRVEAERRAAEEARKRVEEERERIARELDEQLARERERLEAERKTAEEDLRRQLEQEREAMRQRAEQELAAEREKLEREANERRAAAKKALATPKPSLVDTITGWFRREPRARTVNLTTRRITANGNTTATRRTQPAPSTKRAAAPAAATKPRLLFIERRRATADVASTKLRQRGIDVEVVERWVDAVDEIFRFRPNALFLDHEHPEFDKIHRTICDKTSQMPLVVTGRSTTAAPSGIRYAAFVPRPYDVDEVARLAQVAFQRPEDLLAEQSIPRNAPAKPASAPPPPAPAPKPVVHRPAPAPAPVAAAPARAPKVSNGETYEVPCFHCRVAFDAVEADWCSCLTKERTLVCTNCLACFCKAPPAYKEKFWVEAPPRLFERKTSEARRQEATLPANPPKDEVMRPLVLCVEDDEEIQAIVQRVCTNLGYGFVWANNGQDGLEIAHEYKPNLILSDAFMPKLDGREMCRQLKEEGADYPMVVMTGLYTDTKYRGEAVKRFHVDDYIAKPVAITDLVNLLQRHLEGVTGLPVQEDLHELHRREVEEHAASELGEHDVPLAEILGPTSLPIAAPKTTAPSLAARVDRSYEVACFNCQLTFDATRAEWCSCVGRDNTLVCEHCGGCFCKAPAAYRERFWIDAPPSLFERKMIGSKRNLGARHNPLPAEVKRPLILLVEDDENVQLIVKTVVSSMGYGFVVGANGQEGLSLAREYGPDLILSDAFMPKLDGREMCRLLKEDPTTSRTKAIIMTGLYTDRKYRNEALDYFKVDDYVAKPLAVDDLIKLFKKHLPQEVTTAH